METANYLHNKYGERSKQVSPIRIYKFTREDLIREFANLGLSKGAEIGVKRGIFSKFMCNTIPDLELTCVDPWRKLKDDYRSRTIEVEKSDTLYERAKQTLAPYNCKITRDTSFEAVIDIPMESLDFVYIDGSHEFDYVMTDIIEWSKRVRVGGIVAGDDYYRFRRSGVVQAVDLYTHMHGIDEWFITSDDAPTWFWARPPILFYD